MLFIRSWRLNIERHHKNKKKLIEITKWETNNENNIWYCNNIKRNAWQSHNIKWYEVWKYYL